MITFVSKNYTMQKCQILHNKKSVDILIPIRFVVHNVRQTDTAHQKTHRSVNQERFRTLLHTTRRNNENMTNTSTNLYDQYIHKSVLLYASMMSVFLFNASSLYVYFTYLRKLCGLHMTDCQACQADGWVTYLQDMKGISHYLITHTNTCTYIII